MATSILLAAASPLAPSTLADLLGTLWNVLIFLAVVGASIGGGVLLARWFRMPDHAWRIGVVLFSVLLGAVIVIRGCLERRAVLDEKATAAYTAFSQQVDRDTDAKLKKLKPNLSQQQKEVEQQNIERTAANRREEWLAEHNAFRWSWRMPKLGIDLRGGVILVYEVDKAAAKAKGETVDMDKLIAAISRRVNPSGAKEVTIRPYGFQQVEIIVPEVDQQEVDRLKRVVSSIGTLEFRILATTNNDNHKRLIDQIGKGDVPKGLNARWVPIKKGEERSYGGEFDTRTNAKGETEILVYLDKFNVTGDYLTSAVPGVDQRGAPAVEFSFDSKGATLFGGLTGTHLPGAGSDNYHLGIILDQYLQSAPTIQSTITDRGEITGHFTKEEVEDLVGVLNAGSLPAALAKEPVSEQNIGPTLGADSIEKSKWALLASVASVMVFMTIYYRFSGAVASMAVGLNILLTVAAMIAIQAPFTLPGFAGLALTLGMAVDANVLLYERMREELGRGASLRMAIRNGYSRAMSTIVDANLTTVIAAIVLYVIGTDQIKGFAVTLTLGIIISMFTAVFCSRVVFDVFERMRWISKLKMMQFVGVTNFNFMGFFRWCVAGSLAVIALGLALSGYRGKGMLSIDFIGGVSIEALLKESMPINVVRDKVASLPDVTVTDTNYVGEKPGQRFKLETSDPDVKSVQKKLIELFPGQLATNSLKFELRPAAEKPEKKGGAKADKKGTAKADSTKPSTSAELTFGEKVDHNTVEALFKQELGNERFKKAALTITNPFYTEDSSTPYQKWTLTTDLPEGQLREALQKLEQKIATTPYFPSSNTIGGKVAGNTFEKAIYALLASMFFIALYLWVRFEKVVFGIAAVVALIHDVLVTIAFVAFSYWLTRVFGWLAVDPFKIDLNIVAALLTIIGYSVNDTVVIFDRIREVRGKSPDMTPAMINASVNQTLSRSILTSLTVLLVVLILYIWGGTAIHGFAYSLLVGVFAGAYSTIYIAAPLLLIISKPKPGPQGSRRAADDAPPALAQAGRGAEPKSA